MKVDGDRDEVDGWRRCKKDGGGGWGEVFVVSEKAGGDLGGVGSNWVALAPFSL